MTRQIVNQLIILEETAIALYDPFLNPSTEVDLFFSMYKANLANVRKIEEKLAPLGLSLGRLCLLRALQRIGRPALPSELGDDLAVTRANISGLLRGLEKAGMVRREIDASDRRRVLVHLTPRGIETLRQAWPLYEEAIAGQFHALSPDEKRAMLSLLRKLPAGG
jgi:MarR family 2-MHQ and catechol resistance regulon transcriptional repressor